MGDRRLAWFSSVPCGFLPEENSVLPWLALGHVVGRNCMALGRDHASREPLDLFQRRDEVAAAVGGRRARLRAPRVGVTREP